MERTSWMRKATAEFVVILFGVIVALAADRWIQGLDDSARAEAYVSRLLQDLREDSITLARRVTMASEKRAWGLGVLSVIEGDWPLDSLDVASASRNFETFWRFNPLQPSTAAWDDLLSTGNISLLRPAARESLARYYGRLESRMRVEADFDQQMRGFATEAWNVQPPLTRLTVLGVPTPVSHDRQVGGSERITSNLVKALRERPQLIAGLGQATLIWNDQAVSEAGLLVRTVDLITRLDRRAP